MDVDLAVQQLVQEVRGAGTPNACPNDRDPGHVLVLQLLAGQALRALDTHGFLCTDVMRPTDQHQEAEEACCTPGRYLTPLKVV